MATHIGKLRYDPDVIIGRGNGTIVFNGFFRESYLYFFGSDEPVAVKRVQKIDIKQSEVEIMRQTTGNPNILRFIHTEENKDYLFLATELCRGTLGDYIHNKYKGPKFDCESDIFLQVTKGLAYLHELGIVHRDIKPSNILIFVPPSESADVGATESSIKPQIKLADFGISKALDDGKDDYTNTGRSNPNGTKGWIAPEMYHRERFDSKADIFPLGCIFAYTLSSGKHPFGEKDDERSFRIRNKKPMLMVQQDLMKPYSDDAGVFKLIKSMLRINPSKRPNVQTILGNEFFSMFSLEGQTQKLMEICLSLWKKNTINDYSVAYQQLKYLLQYAKVNANSTTEYVQTPLHFVCQYLKNYNLIDIVKLLIQNGADVNAKDYAGWTPLHYLCANYKYDNLIDLVRLLIQNGADVNAKDVNNWVSLHSICRGYKNDNLIDILKLFLRNGADVKAKDSLERTPLHLLCTFYQNDNLIDIVKLLIQNGADVNAREKTPAARYPEDLDGATPLHELCRYYENNELIMDIVKIMTDNGANIKSVATMLYTRQKTTPLNLLRNRGISM